MANIGRNDPCPCGSGKKYKKCCLLKLYIEIGKEESLKTKLVKDILAFSKKYYGNLIDYAYEYFWDDFDPYKELSGSALEMANLNFWEWLVYDWVPDDECGRTLIELYIENNRKLTLDELKVLNIMKNSVISLYEVQEVFPEKGLLLKDLLIGGEYDVREKTATRSVRKWDIFATRLLHLDGKYIMSACVYPYSLKYKESLITYIKEEFEEYKKDFPDRTMDEFLKTDGDLFNFLWYDAIKNPPKIKLMTTTGESLLFSKALYEVKDKDAVINGLRKIEGFQQENENEVVWLTERDEEESATVLGRIEIKDNNLILECNSKERLEKGKKLFSKFIFDSIIHKADVFQDFEQAIESLKDSPAEKSVNELPLEVQQELYTHFMQKHLENWLNDKIPALGNKTPFEAIKTEDGKKKVIELLKDLENREEHNKREGRPYFDTSWMWERLNLERES
ncbi:MAG: SEC-C metal-binding domain-containing protein [candidate division WOR-3 bacterium]